MKKFLIKKAKGQGDLIAAMVVVLGLSVFVLFFISTMGDVLTRTNLDQIARKYILRMESQGELTPNDKNALINEMKSLQAVKKALDNGADPSLVKVTWQTANNAVNTKGKYGDSITLTIECPAVTTAWNTGGTAAGMVTRNRVVVYKVTKQSTAKY